MALQAKISADVQEFEKNFNKAIKLTSDFAKDVERSSKPIDSSLDKVGRSAKKMSDKATEAMGKVTASVEMTTEEIKKWDAAARANVNRSTPLVDPEAAEAAAAGMKELRLSTETVVEATENLSDATSKNVAQLNKQRISLSELSDSLIKAGKAMSLTFTAAITAAAGGSLFLATRAGQASAKLLDLAEIAGTTTEKLQEYRYVATQAGVDQDIFADVAERLIRRLRDVGDEGSRISLVLKSIGVETKTANGALRSSGEIVEDAILSLANMRNSVERSTIGVQLFGRGWKNIVPMLSLGSAGIENLKREAHELGLVLDDEAIKGANEFRIAMDGLKSVSSGLVGQLGSKLAPLLNDTIVPILRDKIVPAFARVIDVLGKVIDRFNKMDPVWKNTAIAIGSVVAAVGPLLLALGGIIKIAPLVGSAISIMGGPFTLIATVVAAAAAAIILNWDRVKIAVLDVSAKILQGIADIAKKIASFTDIFLHNSIGKRIRNVSESLSGRADSLSASADKARTEMALYDEIQKNARTNADLLSQSTNGLSFAFGQQAIAAEKARLSLDGLRAIYNVVNGKELSGNKFTPQQTIGSLDRGLKIDIPKVDMGEILSDAEALGRDIADSINDGISQVLSEGIPQLISKLAESIGSALATGGNVIEAMGQSLLGGLGSIMVQLGKMTIGAGIAIESVKAALKTLQGVGAIAAGAALVAIGSAFSAGARRLGDSMGNGGSAGYRNSAVRYGDPVNVMNYGRMQTVTVTGEIIGSGDQLRVVLNNAERKAGRIR